ncbi:Transcription factor bHLH30 [Platanthera zijinensis]|uniref:Transcription factor bHLH30 n=1 Tax=Platanthera zijinensis TaxID=2320716 RepID=A0AAP0BBW2_9ASPA
MGSIPIGDFRGLGGFLDSGVFGIGSSSAAAAAALVLDGESGELVQALGKSAKKGGGVVVDSRSAMALKSHSEAERRRRERINGHLSTLRRMIPCTDKLDKAGLLAEVINHIKKLKGDAIDIAKVCTIPSDSDELTVEIEHECANSNSFFIKASFCCDDRPELLTDLKQLLGSLELKTIHAEISTLGGRVKFIFLMAGEGISNNLERHLFTTSIHQALKSVLDGAGSADYLPNACFISKRRRISPFESSSSSS